MLLALKDGGIITFRDDDTYHTDGCETCDFGSRYVSRFSVEMTTGTAEFKFEQMYGYVMMQSDLMKTILPNVAEIQQMTEHEFYDWLVAKFKKIKPLTEYRNYTFTHRWVGK